MEIPFPALPVSTAVTACQRCGAESSIQSVVRCSECGNRASDGTTCHQICLNCGGRIGCEQECLHCGACETTLNSAHRAHCGKYHEKCFDTCIKNVEQCVFGTACNHSNHPCCAAENCARGTDSHKCCRGTECAIRQAVEAITNNDPFPPESPQHCCLGPACLLRSQRHQCCRGANCEFNRSTAPPFQMHPVVIPIEPPQLPTSIEPSRLPTSTSRQSVERLNTCLVGIAVVFVIIMGYIGNSIIAITLMTSKTNYALSQFFKPHARYPLSHSTAFHFKKMTSLPISWNGNRIFSMNNTHAYTSPVLEFINGRHENDEIIFAGVLDKSLSYLFSPSGTALAVLNQVKKKFCHESVYKLSVALINENKQKSTEFFQKNGISAFYWLPSINKVTGIENYIFVYNNNVYLNGIRLTDSKSELHYFGVSDWIYREEILKSDKAVFVSPNGNHFAYIEFDDNLIPTFEVAQYIEGKKRPFFTSCSYPKVNDTNPTVKLWISSVENTKSIEIKVPNEFVNQDYYIFNVALSTNYVVSVWANRNQNNVIVKTNSLIDGYPEMHRPLRWSMFVNGFKHWAEPNWFIPTCANASGYYLLTPSPAKDNVFNGVTRIDLRKSSSNPIVQSTAVFFDENLPVYCDEKTGDFFFISNGGDQHKQNLYRKGISGDPAELVFFENTDCKIVQNVQFVGDYLFANCQKNIYGPGIFVVKNFRTNEYVVKKVQNEISDNLNLLKTEENELTINNITIQTTTIFPKKFNRNRLIKHPLLLYVYNGPNTNSLLNISPLLSLFAAYRGYIIVLINSRGTGGRGWKHSNPISMSMGHIEAEDAIAATKAIIESLKHKVDSQKIGVLGWNYGGFISGHIAAKDHGKIFKCASLGAPVTDFRLHDSAYTERYLHLNETAYNQTSLLQKDKVVAMGHVKLQLIHSLADDNVHFQHHALLSKMLQENGIHFRQSVYSNDNSIQLSYVENEIDKFFTEECFGFPLDIY